MKAAQEERIQKWKEHFKNQFGNSPKVNDKLIQKIINRQLDIKLGQFTEGKLDTVLKTIRCEKVAGFNKIPLEV